MKKIEKLLPEHIVGYFPYNLELEATHKGFNTKEKRMLSFDCGHDFYLKLTFGEIKPKLKPIKSLTEEELSQFSICFRLWYGKDNFDYSQMIYSDIEICHKLHLDYRGLIESGLAVEK